MPNPLIVFVYSITIWSFAEKIKTFIARCGLPVAIRIQINACWFQSGLISSPVSEPHLPFVSPSILIIGLQEKKNPINRESRLISKTPKRPSEEQKYIWDNDLTVSNIWEQKAHCLNKFYQLKFSKCHFSFREILRVPLNYTLGN